MKKLSKLLALLLCALMTVTMFACGEDDVQGGTSAGGKEEVKLVVWCAQEDKPFLDSVQEAYRAAHPDKTYKFLWGALGENEAATKVLNDVQNAPDVFSFPSDQLHKLINGDALARFGGARLATIRNSNDAAAFGSATVTIRGEEQTYGIPYTDNTFFLYYDKSKLTEDDVKSLDGILAKCSATERFAMPMGNSWYNSSFYFSKGLGYEVTYDDSLGEKTVSCDFDCQTGLDVSNALYGYVRDERVKPDADDSSILAGFNDGSIIAATTGIWNKTKIQEYLGDNFAVAKLPTYTLNGEQVQLINFAGYKLIGVSKHSKNLVEAQEFALFYTNMENQLKHFDTRGYVPTNIEARKDQKILSDACARAISAQLQFSKTQSGVPSSFWSAMDGIGTAMINAKDGTLNVQEQLTATVGAIIGDKAAE